MVWHQLQLHEQQAHADPRARHSAPAVLLRLVMKFSESWSSCDTAAISPVARHRNSLTSPPTLSSLLLEILKSVKATGRPGRSSWCWSDGVGVGGCVCFTGQSLSSQCRPSLLSCVFWGGGGCPVGPYHVTPRPSVPAQARAALNGA